MELPPQPLSYMTLLNLTIPEVHPNCNLKDKKSVETVAFRFRRSSYMAGHGPFTNLYLRLSLSPWYHKAGGARYSQFFHLGSRKFEFVKQHILQLRCQPLPIAVLQTLL